MSKAQILQAAQCIREAAKMIQDISDVLPHMGDLVDNWRYPITDELDGTASWMEKELVVDDTVFVSPSINAVKNDWDRPDQYQWPGKVVYRYITPNGKQICQFLVFDKLAQIYVLKTWGIENLEIIQ